MSKEKNIFLYKLYCFCLLGKTLANKFRFLFWYMSKKFCFFKILSPYNRHPNGGWFSSKGYFPYKILKYQWTLGHFGWFWGYWRLCWESSNTSSGQLNNEVILPNNGISEDSWFIKWQGVVSWSGEKEEKKCQGMEFYIRYSFYSCQSTKIMKHHFSLFVTTSNALLARKIEILKIPASLF